MLSVKKLMYKVLTVFGANGNDVHSISVSNDTVFTAPYTGTLYVEGQTQSGVTTAPFIQLQACNDSGSVTANLDSSWGITISGAITGASAQVRKGCKYRVHALRATIANAYIVGGYCVTSVFSRLSAIASHLKGWWHHVKSEENSVQDTWHADRIKYTHNNSVWKTVVLPQSRTHSVLRCSERYRKCISRCKHVRNSTSRVQTASSAEAWMWKPFELEWLCSDRNERSVHPIYTERNHICIERWILGNVPIGFITSSISERGWAVC